MSTVLEQPPEAQLLQLTRAYVRYASLRPAHDAPMFGFSLDVRQHPELLPASEQTAAHL